MKAQKPAQGIAKVNDFGDSIWYHVECECQYPDHCHTIEVEADHEMKDVTVNVYTEVSTPFWSRSRWKMIWEILTKGYSSHEACIILSKQATLNYAAALKSAIKEIEDRENAR